MKTAIITGITGQDGSYLAELLLKEGYRVFGVVRKSSVFNTERIDHLQAESSSQSNIDVPVWARYFADNLFMIYGDLMDGSSIARMVYDIQPDEVYNLGAQAHVRVSFDQPELTMNVNAVGNLRLLTAIESLNKNKKVKFYQASSSEMFGNHPAGTLLHENSSFYPCSPYAIAKAAAYQQTLNSRKKGMFAVNGILFNHESPRRGATYVTRKITRAATRIYCGLQRELALGNLAASRDWGYAPDYVRAMHMMMQRDEPDDFVIATGYTTTVQQFLETVFSKLSLNVSDYVRIDKRYFREVELDCLQGDSSKARSVLGWEPSVRFEELVDKMIDSDMELAEKEKKCQ